jgi:ATP-dependent exoDNAse (exonuclease V) beta subunit
MGMGYLTQNFDAQTTFDPKSDLRSTFDRFTSKSMAANKPFVDRIGELAKKKDATTAQLLYVALTRAKSRLMLVVSRSNPSPLFTI